eukprot:scaffold8814_cov50-Attheya_sp.AAC.1
MSSRLTPIPPRALQGYHIDPLLTSVDDSSQAEINMPVGLPSQSPSVSFSHTTPRQPNTDAMPTRVNGTTPTSHHPDSPVAPPLRN